MKSIDEVIEEARSEVATMRYPDVSEFKERLNPILKAAGLGSLEHDQIERILVTCEGTPQEALEINTSYSVRGCSQSGEYIIPMSVVRLVDTSEGLTAPKVWAAEKRIKHLESKVRTAKNELKGYQEELDIANLELEKLRKA